jgi:2-polyprenyl-3-methyl-5-hydroxy-6-metoxy-1,4-benzoquinol methylase
MAYTSASPGPATSSSGLSLDRLLRKLFPSTSKLTFNPLFRAAVNASDAVPRLMFPEFRTLPPNHLRIRVGVGNRIFNNQTHFLVHARDFWMFALSEGIVSLESNILDIGVGCGRWAHWMRDCNFRGRRYCGAYVGVDIDGEVIAWCQKNYDAERFRFHHSSHGSVSYNQNGSASSSYRTPEADGTFDLVFSNSLLTHLLEAELGNYLRETFRLLQAGGTMMHSHFNMEHLPATYGKRHTFKYQLGNARIESETQPEAAVAYHTDYLFRLCRQIGFSSCEIVHMPGGEQHQPILLCRK